MEHLFETVEMGGVGNIFVMVECNWTFKQRRQRGGRMGYKFGMGLFGGL